MAKPGTPVDVLTFNVTGDSASYKWFMSALRGKLAGKAGKNIQEHPILDGPQTGNNNPPPRWIYVVLSSRDGVNPKVAIRSDNAYIAGFTNSHGDWFQFKSDTGKTENILPDATVLGFSGDYNALVGNPIRNLPQLNLGKERTMDAASVLWSHKKLADENDDDDKDNAIITGSVGPDDQPKPEDPEKDLKRKLATLAVTLCEAARFIPVHDVVAEDWGKQDVFVTEKQVNFISKWGQLSTALLGWANDGFKNDDKWFKHVKQSTGIATGDDALKVVQLVLDKPPKGEEPEAGEEGPAAAGEE